MDVELTNIANSDDKPVAPKHNLQMVLQKQAKFLEQCREVKVGRHVNDTSILSSNDWCDGATAGLFFSYKSLKSRSLSISISLFQELINFYCRPIKRNSSVQLRLSFL